MATPLLDILLALQLAENSRGPVQVTTAPATGAGIDGALLGATVRSNGNTVKAVLVAVRLQSAADYTGAAMVTCANTSGDEYAGAITGLSASTDYVARAFVLDSSGAVTTGQEVFLYTLGLPVVATGAISDIEGTTATASGEVLSADSTVTLRGVCYSTSASPTTDDSTADDGSGVGLFFCYLTGLSLGTTYYVRAYAVSTEGTGYGPESTFTTYNVPEVTTTDPVTLNSSTEALLGGFATADPAKPVLDYGFYYVAGTAPPTALDTVVSFTGDPSGNFSQLVSGLSPFTTYSCRAFATNSVGTALGSVVTFTTLDNLASVSAPSAFVDITQTSATAANSSFSSLSPVTESGICYAETGTAFPTVANFKVVSSGGTSPFNSAMTGLSSAVPYNVRAYAVNSAGTSYSSVVTFSTLPVPPEVTGTTVNSITSTGATVTATASAQAGFTATGVCLSSTTTTPTTNDTVISGSTSGTTSFISAAFTGLAPGTVYHVRAYAANSGGITYGDGVSFTTFASVSSSTFVQIDQTSAKANSSFVSASTVTESGICYKTTDPGDPTTADSKVVNTGGNPSFNSIMTGLLPWNSYKVRAYAINSAGTSYGALSTFSTLPLPPEVTNTVFTSITSTGATVSATASAPAGVTAAGVCLSATTATPTTSDTDVTSADAYAIVSTFTGLAPGAVYYVRAYATNSGGITYGDSVSFTTLVA